MHQLRARHGWYDDFLRFQPTITACYTVTIYHISVEQANRIRRDLGLPDIGANTLRNRFDSSCVARIRSLRSSFSPFMVVAGCLGGSAHLGNFV